MVGAFFAARSGRVEVWRQLGPSQPSTIKVRPFDGHQFAWGWTGWTMTGQYGSISIVRLNSGTTVVALGARCSKKCMTLIANRSRLQMTMVVKNVQTGLFTREPVEKEQQRSPGWPGGATMRRGVNVDLAGWPERRESVWPD